MEIERKFLIADLPNLTTYSSVAIIQSYISFTPVIRLRQMEKDYFLTIKSKGHILRQEFELPITAEQYAHLYLKTEGLPIKKRRYFIPISSLYTAELDIYEEALEGLLTVEVEFTSLEEAQSFIPPVWFGTEISTDPRYKNNHLAQWGLPT